MTGLGAAGAAASWFGGSIHPDTGHWRQFEIFARAMGHKKGNNVTEMGSFRPPLAMTANRRFHDNCITAGGRILAEQAAEQSRKPQFDIVAANERPLEQPPQRGGFRPPPATVRFNRKELQTILNVYGRHVAEGEWRDYAIDFLQRPGRCFLDLSQPLRAATLRDREEPETARAAGPVSADLPARPRASSAGRTLVATCSACSNRV